MERLGRYPERILPQARTMPSMSSSYHGCRPGEAQAWPMRTTPVLRSFRRDEHNFDEAFGADETGLDGCTSGEVLADGRAIRRVHRLEVRHISDVNDGIGEIGEAESGRLHGPLDTRHGFRGLRFDVALVGGVVAEDAGDIQAVADLDRAA